MGPLVKRMSYIRTYKRFYLIFYVKAFRVTNLKVVFWEKRKTKYMANIQWLCHTNFNLLVLRTNLKIYCVEKRNIPKILYRDWISSERIKKGFFSRGKDFKLLYTRVYSRIWQRKVKTRSTDLFHGFSREG